MSWVLCLFAVLCSQRSFAAPPKTFVIGSTYEFSPINPYWTANSISANIIDIIFDPLVNKGAQGVFEPRLAQSWTVSDDLKEWRFKLRPNVVFHDGHPFSSEDVVFAFGLLKQSIPPVLQLNAANILNVQAVNPTEVIIRLKKPDQGFLDFMYYLLIGPAHLLQADGHWKPDVVLPIGTGAFVAHEVSSRLVVLKANPRYFLGRPRLDEARFQTSENSRRLMAQMLDQSVDLYLMPELKNLPALSNVPHLKIDPIADPILYAVFLNLRDTNWKSAKLRQALNYAVNKAALLERALRGYGQVAEGVVYPGHPDYTPVAPYEYDPKKALALLAEEGWRRDAASGHLMREGERLSLEILVSPEDELLALCLQVLANDLEDIGIKVSFVSPPLLEMIGRTFQKPSFQAVSFLFNTSLGLNGDYAYWRTSEAGVGLNFTGYDNKIVAENLSAAKFNADPLQARQAYFQFQRTLHDDPPCIYLLWINAPLIYNARVKNLNKNSQLFYRQFYRVDVAAEE